MSVCGHRPLSPPSPTRPPMSLLSLWVCLFGMFHADGVIRNVGFRVWLLSFKYNVFEAQLCHSLSQCCIGFAARCFTDWLGLAVSLPSSADGHLGCLRLLAVVSHAAVNVHPQVLWGPVCLSAGSLPRSAADGLCADSANVRSALLRSCLGPTRTENSTGQWSRESWEGNRPGDNLSGT